MIISSDLSVQLTANRVAEMMNVSTAKFRADFKRHTGTTFKKSLTDLRMTRAYELLQSGSSIINASLETGYWKRSALYRGFPPVLGQNSWELCSGQKVRVKEFGTNPFCRIPFYKIIAYLPASDFNCALNVSSFEFTLFADSARPDAMLRLFSAIAIRKNPSRSSSQSTVSP